MIVLLQRCKKKRRGVEDIGQKTHLTFPQISGLATASTNLSWTLFPIIVAALSNLDPTYTYTLLFFAACCLAGVAVCIWLYFIDQIYYDGIMEMPEKSAAVIAVKPTLTS